MPPIINNLKYGVCVVVGYLVIINVLAFVLYGIDKRKARKDKYRISESTLLWMARLGGGVGSWIGIRKFHHKTKHKRFVIIVPLWTIVWVVGIVYLVIRYY